MPEIEDYIKISWQLVSQFVSWDFCRYSYEKSEDETTEADVLTFLRNMIVERTEKAASDITKQEIIAKFIMETKTIRTLSRMPCVIALGNTVKRICPELKQAVKELVTHLDTFLEKLDYNEDSEKIEILETRMTNVVNDFSKKACDVLPVPDIFKVVQTYLQCDSQSQKLSMHQPKNLELYRNVLNLLRQELKHIEVKTIQNALLDDEEFKSVMYTLKTREDSLDLSIASSQKPLQNSLADSLRLSDRFEVQECNIPNLAPLEENSLNLDNSSPISYQTLCKAPVIGYKRNSYFEISKEPFQLAEKIDKLGPLTDSEAFLFENPDPTPLFPSKTQKNESSPRKVNFPENFFNDKRSSERMFSDPIIINVQSCDEEKAEESDCDFMTQRPAKLKYMHKHPRKKKAKIVSDYSDSEDTSDCDKDPEFRFLTPTFFKKGVSEAQKVIYISDQESCGSSIITTYVDSQQNDPSFKTKTNIFTKPGVTTERKNLKKPSKKKKPKAKSSAKLPTTRQTTLRMFTTPKPSLDESSVDFKKDNKNKKFKLFNTDRSTPLPNKTPARKRKPSKEILQGIGNKRHCNECRMTFRTPSELKKHIFIFHTNDDFSE